MNHQAVTPVTFEGLRDAIGEIAEVPVDWVTEDAEPLNLGLDSIRLMRLAGRLRRDGIAVRFADLAERQTVGEWWRLIRGAGSVATPIPGEAATESGEWPAKNPSTGHEVTESEPFDLAVMQHAFWVGRSKGQRLGGVAAHFYTEFDAEAPGIDPDRLEPAVRALVERHGMLRVRVSDDGRQQIGDTPAWAELQVHDLRELAQGEVDNRLAELRAQLSHRVMDIAIGDVFDVRLSLLPGGASRLHVNLDMVAADALSLRVLLADLAKIYQGRGVALPPLRYSYPRYLAERLPVRRQARDRAAEWWAERLADLPSAPVLPVTASDANARPTVTRRHHWLPPRHKRRLADLAHQRGLTPAAVLATAFAEVMGRWSASDRFLLNLPVFDREPLHDDVDAMVGDFSSSVLLDVDLTESLPFVERTGQLQKDLREALSHAEYTGVEVLRDLTRAAGGDPVLAPVVFTSALELGDLFASEVQRCFGRPSWIISQGPQVWLDAQVTELDDGVLLNWDARESVFPAGVLDAMFGAYVDLVEQLLADGDSWDQPVPAALPGAQQEARARVNTTERAGGAGLLYERFFRLAATQPDRVALVWGERESMSYGELSRRARRVTALLAAYGVQPGDCVGVTLPKGPDQAVAVLGVLAMGAAYVPSGIDVPMERRAQVYELAGSSVVLTDTARATEAGWPAEVTAVAVSDALDHSPAASIVGVDSEAVMYVLFTSGSTGVPKGVEVPHRAVANTVDAVNDMFGVNGSDRTIALSSLDFDLSSYDLFAFLACGGSVVVLDESQRRDAHAWAEQIRRWDVTVVSCVPALLDMLLVAGAEHLPDALLRLVMLGGDWVTVDLPSRLRSLVPGCRFAGLGGMTEAAIHSTVFEVQPSEVPGVTECGKGPVDPSWRAVPYGVPLANMRCRVADAHGRDCPDWVPGELWVSGPGVALGYRGDQRRTTDKFVNHDGRRWYRTGDLARYWPDGTLEFLGRADHQVKIRGHRIELGEVEAHLTAHPCVGKAVGVVIDGATRRLAAAVVLAQPSDPAELRRWLADRVPGYMVPEQIDTLDEFPVTKNGKIDRKAIRHALAVGVDEVADADPPRGDLEEAVASLWRELLDVERVGRTDSFFALGGDSLLATRLVSRLREAGLAGGALAALFATPVLSEFAAMLSPAEVQPARAVEPDSANRNEPFALTDVQRAYWIGRDSRLPLGGVASHFYLELDGVDIDVVRLEEAWNRLIGRHEMLRAVIDVDGRQRILPEVPRYRIGVTHAGAEPQEALRELRDDVSHHVADPERGPLFVIRAVSYVEDGQARLRVGVGLDSLVLDGRSVMVLFTEWDALYRDLDAPLPALSVSFRDYLLQVQPEPSRLAAAEDYWRSRAAELPPAPGLPLAADPETIRRPRFRRSHATIDTERWHQLTARARGHGLTPTAVLLSCYAHVLATWSGQPELTVNLTLFDRDDVHPEINNIVGDFSSLLLVGCRAEPGDSFLDTARGVQEQMWRDLDHREVSGVQVLRELARRNDAAMQAMPVVFTSVLGIGDDASLDLSDAFPTPVYGVTQTPQVWLDLKVSETRAGLVIDWDCVDELFPAGLADAMFAAYVELVERLADRPWERSIPVELPDDQRAVRARVNATGGPAPESVAGDGVLHAGFFARAAEAPGQVALLWDGGQLTYGELASRVLRIAGWLVEQGTRPGDAVVVSLPKGADQVAALLGVLAAGGVYVPVGVDLPQLRRERVISGSEAVLVVDDLAAAANAAPLAKPVPVDPAQLAYVIFTSGSTGVPKGVEVAHRSAVNTVDDINTRFGVGPEDRVLAVSAADFDLSVYDVFGILAAGGGLVLIDEGERRDAQRWVELVRTHRVTVWNTVPALLDMLVTVAETGAGLPALLRLAMVSGDWVGLDLPGRVRSLVPGCRFVALGGATEASIWSNAYEVDRLDPGWSSVPYGGPLRNQSFRVVDRWGGDCPDWVPGELWIGGAGVARGYRGDPAKTAEKFVEYADERWYRTGDLGRYWPDGTLEFLGRADTQVKVRGHRIELGEIEAALLAHPAVAQAVCVAPGERDRRRLVAFVGVDSDALGGLNEFLAQRLPSHAIPGRIVTVDAFPLTANGKVDRVELTRHGAKADEVTDFTGAAEPPVGAVEETVARMWCELLGVSQVARQDSFFALGGDSLLATRLMTRLRDAGLTGAELANLFAEPVLAGFAATLTEGDAPPAQTIEPDPDNRHEPFPLTDVQQAYWLGRRQEFALGGVGAHFYVEYERDDLDIARLEESWNRLIDRHDMLRAVIDGNGGQRVLSDVSRHRIAVIEAGADAEMILAQTRERMSRQTLDPLVWPLFDIQVVRYRGRRARLCVTFDNLIVDGLSILTLFAEWDQLYADLDAELPPITLSFRDYVQQARPTPAALDEAHQYWESQLAQLPPAPQLPVRVEPRSLGSPRFERRETRLDPATWHAITERARRHGLTPSVVVLACYADVLAEASEQRELTVNLTLFDRRPVHSDVNAVVGDFTSLLLVAHRIVAGESWLERTSRLQEQVWRDLDHREVSGVRVLRELARRNDTGVEAMPVVFTSMLGVNDGLAGSVRWPDHTRTQTPQVWLDHQVIERADGVLLSWDFVDGLFPDGLIDDMFATYKAALRGLATSDWTAPLTDQLPADGADAVFAGPIGDAIRPGRHEGVFEPPAGALEETLATLWAELLEADRIGRWDGFFALGGDSLLATRLLARLSNAGLMDAELAQLYGSPTLAGFAATLTWGEAEVAPTIEPDPDNRHAAFPLTDIQQAYWLGRRDDFVLGGIAALFATEREYATLDVARLEDAWNRLVDRHEMLRAVVDDDGTQRILPAVPQYRIPVVNDDVEIRDEMNRATVDVSTWPLFDIRVIRRGERFRVAVVFDTMVVDGLSMLTLFAEWDQLYADLDAELPPITLSFRDYVLRSRPDPRRLEAAERYWRRRMTELPPGPQLPVSVDPAEVGTPRFRRRQTRIDTETWQSIAEHAKRHGVTLSVVLLACYADVLAQAGKQPELTVNLTLFDRQPVHPDIDGVVGDFTSLLLVGHRLDDNETWLDRVRRLQEQVWRDLDHREVSGVRVLREMARQNVSLTQAVPVVFTSMLGVDDSVARTVRWPEHARSQTPQVWLDHQAVELSDGVLLSWDYVDQIFPDDVIGDMFAGYERAVRLLADADWETLPATAPPAGQAEDGPAEAIFAGGDAGGAAEPPRTELEREIAELWGEIIGRVPDGRTSNFFALGGDSLAGTRLVQRAIRRYGVDLSLRAFFSAPTVADLAGSINEQRGAFDTVEDGAL